MITHQRVRTSTTGVYRVPFNTSSIVTPVCLHISSKHSLDLIFASRAKSVFLPNWRCRRYRSFALWILNSITFL